ncbi:hydroxymethylglutaryl-CoA lyase [Sphingomonas astaxanthinifaciens]|uniref:hydroxymethylglutaryl-CoA lyase n=1 Tax=Sphingomonas astaxanthinifaciens TaxID=407019 RepID=UPI0004A6B1E7|nr:hydroxymethylglutaryl-CoA lyase [Sphingomonas astaxanthinifaciens]
MTRAVEIVEVSPRDGLQNEPVGLSTADKIALIERVIAAGARRVEVASFVNPRRVPQMADGEAVVAGLPNRSDVRFTGLCLNERGVERALAASAAATRGLDEIGCVLVATDAFGIANQGQTVAQGIAANRAMIAAAKLGGLRAQVTIAASFGCPYEGAVAEDHVLGLAEAMVEAGADEIAFADTIGVAVPAQVASMVANARRRLGDDFPIRVHLHDTRGMAPANAWAAFQEGCRTFDSALGGLGGCPFAPKAAGNLATEELVYMFERAGIATGIDLVAAIDTNRWLAERMGKSLPSRVGRVGDFVPHPPQEQECA